MDTRDDLTVLSGMQRTSGLEELQKCRDDLERLKSEGMEYSAMTGQQAQAGAILIIVALISPNRRNNIQCPRSHCNGC